ncbi:hypothetical protein KFE25_008611 [Diacronema lutheri]|uniref:Isopenicillin N synthase-like Fe(2+) 2OG dioxygenase domain-containing protein n=2 Tax=Diacronema lutheri TaxID=2081491 RepID=A0A8J5XYD8_DIALT|nr:hypothetical protein KFE25_008611 [Diacronema lutheri]
MLPAIPAAAGVGLAAILWGAAARWPTPVPLVELANTERARATLLDAASRLGVFRIRAAPYVSDADVEVALAESFELFTAPSDAEKRAWPVVRFPPIGGMPAPIARGYIPFGGESGVGGAFLEVKEGFAYSHDSGCGRREGEAGEGGDGAPQRVGALLEFCNAWPDGRERFRHAASRLLDGSHRAARHVARQLAAALDAGASGDAVEASLEAGLASSVMRLFHYHSRHHCRETNRTECAARASLAQIGSSPHTDWHALTVIAEGRHGAAVRRWFDTPTGLQFRARGSTRWRTARATRGELLVVVGDLLALSSRGRLHSPVHRVLLPAERGATRTSFTLFAYPRGEDTIGSWVRMLSPGAAAAELVDAARAAARGAAWNTLLAQSGADARAEEPFARILMRKWVGVSTAGHPPEPPGPAVLT